MLKQLQKQILRSKSLPKSLNLLSSKFVMARGKFSRRNAIKAQLDKKFEQPLMASRRKSCDGELFGHFKSSKVWMQLIKIDNPQHRNQNLAKIVFLRLRRGNSNSQQKKIISLKKCFKDQVNLLRILSTFKPKPQPQQTEIQVAPKKPNNSVLHSPKPKRHMKLLFPINKSITIEQPLFPRKENRNWSQIELGSPKAVTQPTSTFASPRKFKTSIMNIYGISNTMHLIKY